MVQTVRMNPYFDISSKTQICQKCHLRPYCIQPTVCVFSLVTKNVKSGSKIALFQMNAILKFDFQKRKRQHFFCRKLSKLHKKEPFLHVTSSLPLNKNKQDQAVDPFGCP